MLIFVSVAIINNVPRISASVSVSSSLIASVAINGILLTSHDVNKFTNNGKISFVSQFFNLQIIVNRSSTSMAMQLIGKDRC